LLGSFFIILINHLPPNVLWTLADGGMILALTTKLGNANIKNLHRNMEVFSLPK
jgi:hypothetical protein